MATVHFKSLYKEFGETKVIKGIDLDLKDGEFVAVVGPSGCGKSTLLRMLAGLEEVSRGDILLDDKNITYLSPGKRSVSMVFQDYALYPHMSVFENLAFGLRLKKLSEDDIKTRVHEAAKMLGLEDYLQRRPKELSGGQRQRVAMGRAVVKKAEVFLFDEPLSNLDAKLRSTMRAEIKRFHKKNKKTTLYVTHDQLEAMTLADRIVILNNGEVEQIGAPLDVFDAPKNIFVARFIGSPEINLFPCKILKEGDVTYLSNEEMGLKFSLPGEKSQYVSEAQEVVMGLRSSDLYISTDDHLSHWSLSAEIDMVEMLGKNAYLTFSFEGNLTAMGEVMGRGLPEIGSKVKVVFNLNHCHLFDKKTGLNLALP